MGPEGAWVGEGEAVGRRIIREERRVWRAMAQSGMRTGDD